MFKFNFNSEAHEPNYKEIKTESSTVISKESKHIDLKPERYLEIAEDVKSAKVNCFISNETEIGYLDSKSLTDESDTDLISGVYEGGFKVWECTQDLADMFTGSEENELEGKSVCDLGCSAGILGILALVNGAKKVVFQDYNEDVLEAFTIPNVILSCEERELPDDFTKCSFYSGDWESFKELTASEDKYDVILTSETIYNPDNYRKLTSFFKSRLASDGKIFLSAKSYYFGVSGNVLDFCKLLDDDKTFSYETVWKSVEGIQREILLIKFNQL